MGYLDRQDAKRIEELEAEGVVLWTKTIDARQRLRLFAAIDITVSADPSGFQLSADLTKGVAQRLLGNNGIVINGEFWGSYSAAVRTQSEAVLLTVLEYAIEQLRSMPHWGADVVGICKHVNAVFREERLSYELVNGDVIDVDSQELNSSVVVPAMKLLSGRSGWEKVEAAYQEAIDQLGVSPANAITDAGTALQQALRSIGAEGNKIGPLAKSAQKKGLLGSHDEPMIKAIVLLLDWVSSDRSAMGDGHNADAAAPEDAWLAVHVVGALILRLANETPRVTPN